MFRSFPALHGARVTECARHPVLVTAIAALAVAVASLVEMAAPGDASFEIVYLGAAAFVAWCCARPWLYCSFAVVAGLAHVASARLGRDAPGSLAAMTGASVGTGSDLPLLWNVSAHLVLFVAGAMLVASVRRDYRREEAEASLDPLTGVTNRRRFLAQLEASVVRAHQRHAAHSVAFLDLDRFRDVNNRQGHERGDAVLVACAAAMRLATPAGAELGRIGGDEFAVYLPCAGPDAMRAAERLRDAVLSVARAEGLDGLLGVSIGLVTCGLERAADARRLLALADELMYRAKALGGNAIVDGMLTEAGSR